MLGTPLIASDRRRVQLGVRQLLASGATVSATTFYERFDNNTPGIDFLPNPASFTGLSVEAVQPLLSGYGSEATTLERQLAASARSRSEAALRADVLALSALTEQAYWSLVEAHGRLAIQERLTSEGEEVERVLAERRDFDAQPAQYADALATVGQRRADTIRARDLVRRTSDQLKALLDWEEVPLASETLLAPTDALEEAPVAVDLRQALAAGIATRPELESALSEIEDAELRARVAENLRQPQLDLTARLDLMGLDDSVGDSASSLIEDELVSFLVGLHFELPAGNRAASAESRRAELEARAAVARYEALLRDVIHEIKDALRDLSPASS